MTATSTKAAHAAARIRNEILPSTAAGKPRPADEAVAVARVLVCPEPGSAEDIARAAAEVAAAALEQLRMTLDHAALI